MSQQNHDPYSDVDWENEDNLPPSALMNNMMGLLIAVGGVLFAGVGAIIMQATDGSAIQGGIIGGIIGVVVAFLFVTFEVARLRRKGR